MLEITGMRRNPKALVIEDTPSWQRELMNILLRVNFEVDIASTSEEAFRQLGKSVYDLVTIDIGLPKETPIAWKSIIHHIREHHPDTKTFIVTGDPTLETAIYAINYYPISGYFPKKDFAMEVFLKKLKEISAVLLPISLLRGKERNAKMNHKKSKELNLKEQRIQDLTDNIEQDMALLKQYEDNLRLANDPREQARCRTNIEQLHESIAGNYEQYEKLVNETTGELKEKLLKFSEGLSDMQAKLDSLLIVQKDIRKDISELKQEIIARFAENEHTIINAVVDRLEKSELVVVNTMLNTVENVDVASNRIEETLAFVHETLVEIRELEGAVSDTILSKAAGEVLEVVDDPKIDVKHKLKVTIPIIPAILKYEGSMELKSGMNLGNAWQWLREKM